MAETHDEGYERRREQVRRAQKTHRARKATYVKSLEDELKWLRERHSSCENELAACRQDIQRLRNVLLTNGLSLPDFLDGSTRSNRLATVRMVGGPTLKSRALQATLPSTINAFHTFDASNTAMDNAQLFPTHSIGTTQSQLHNVMGSPLPLTPTENTITVQAGIDFVLTLEQPCLYHHKVPMPELLVTGSIGNGHQSMLSHPIMTRSPSFSFNPFNSGYPADAEWTVPAAELETLLAFSQKLELGESEITPVQAWQVIRDHESQSLMSRAHLEHIQKALALIVTCHGFGAVIDRDTFEEVLNSTLSSLGSSQASEY